MNYTLRSKDDKVSFLLKTGKDFVKSQMEVGFAENLIKNGKVKKSDKPDYQICVDDKWYFDGTIVRPTKKTKGETE